MIIIRKKKREKRKEIRVQHQDVVGRSSLSRACKKKIKYGIVFFLDAVDCDCGNSNSLKCFFFKKNILK